MNFAATDRGLNPVATPPEGGRIVVGYGNRDRGDDGLGPRVVEELACLLAGQEGISFISAQQLVPELAEDLAGAREVVLIDATVERLPSGIRWSGVEPSLEPPFYLTHSLSPGFLVNLIQCLYQRCPRVSLLSIQGDNFDHGIGLSAGAARRARKAVRHLTDHFTKEG